MSRSILILLMISMIAFIEADDTMSWYHLRVAGYRPDSREGAAFFTRSTGDLVLFGGFQENNAINTGPNIYFNDMFQLDVTRNTSCGDPQTPGCNVNTEFYTWRRIQNGTNAPEKRALFCWAYDKQGDRLYIFGGVNYTNTFTSFTFYNDTWRFDFSTNLWTKLATTDSPAKRAGVSCTAYNGNMYLFGGSALTPSFVSIAYDELWRLNFASLTWTLLGSENLNQSGGLPWPQERLQFNFLELPGTDRFFLTDGFRENQFGVAMPFNDVWIYDVSADRWTQLDNEGHPTVIREYMAAVALSSRFIMFQGGDAQGNRTAADVCKPPLVCFIASSPTDNTFIYDIEREEFTELFLDRTLPPLRRAMMTRTKENLITLFGGHNFDGANGVGALRDRHTWALEPKARYLNN